MTLLDHTGTIAGDHDARHDLLLARAAFLRDVAADLEPLVATSFRRRACELELTAWVLGLRSGL